MLDAKRSVSITKSQQIQGQPLVQINLSFDVHKFLVGFSRTPKKLGKQEQFSQTKKKKKRKKERK